MFRLAFSFWFSLSGLEHAANEVSSAQIMSQDINFFIDIDLHYNYINFRPKRSQGENNYCV